MPRHLEVRVRVPINKVGEFIDNVLPDWADLAGVDKLYELEKTPGSKAKTLNGDGRPPAKDSCGAGILRVVGNGKTTRTEIVDSLKAKWKPAAISSALYDLRRRGFLKQAADQSWELVRQ